MPVEWPEPETMHHRFLGMLLLASAAAMPLAVLTWQNLFQTGHDGVGPLGAHYGLDFVNFWSAGRLALEGLVADGYDPETYKALLATWFAPAKIFTNLSYPPSLLVLLAPVALLPYACAYVAWSLLGSAAFIFAALGRRPGARDLPLVALLLMSPIVISNLVFGQIALFVAALFVFALRILPARPVLAGVMFGLLTVKPQLGILVPVFLLAIGAWRTIASAAATAGVLALVSIALFGVAPWHAYLTDTAALQWSYILAMDDFYAIHMITPYAAFWTLGLPVDVALAGQWAASAALVVTTFAVARSNADWPLKSAVLLLGAAMAVPYVLAHDLAAPMAAMVWYWSTRTGAPSNAELGLSGALWALPFPLSFLLQLKGVPATEIAMTALYCLLAARALAYRPAIVRDAAHATAQPA